MADSSKLPKDFPKEGVGKVPEPISKHNKLTFPWSNDIKALLLRRSLYSEALKTLSNMISLVLFIASLAGAHACTCGNRPSVKEAYCSPDVDIVTLARVLSTNNSDTRPDGAWKYEIWHLRTWKGLEKVKNNATSILTTANSESVCGLTGLLDEWDYLLAGKFEKNGEIKIKSCDLYMAWYDVTAVERDLLRNLRDKVEECE